MHSKRSHIAIYGNVSIRREYCNGCQTFGLVIDERIQCCDRKVDVEDVPKRYKRITQPDQQRRLPPKRLRDEQLALQENRCFYCGWTFGAHVFRGKRPIRVRMHWDHKVPYALTQNNNAANFVAACHICNGIKSDYVFTTVDEARIFLAEKRKEKGYV